MPPVQLTITDKMVTLFREPTFWIGSVFVALFVNVIGSYVTRVTDRIGAVFSTRIKKSNETKRQRIEQIVDRIVSDPIERIDIKLDLLVYILKQVLILSFIIFLIIMVIDTHNVVLEAAGYSFIVIQLIIYFKYVLDEGNTINIIKAYNRRKHKT